MIKLDGLVKTNPEGNYELTDDGREALRILGTMKRTIGVEVKHKLLIDTSG